MWCFYYQKMISEEWGNQLTGTVSHNISWRSMFTVKSIIINLIVCVGVDMKVIIIYKFNHLINLLLFLVGQIIKEETWFKIKHDNV